jgi:hypothetical protein
METSADAVQQVLVTDTLQKIGDCRQMYLLVQTAQRWCHRALQTIELNLLLPAWHISGVPG